MQNQITIEQIQATVLANWEVFVDNLESDEQYIESLKSHPDYAELVHDNLLLERYGYIVYLESNPDCPPFTMKEIKLVYEAAKVVFAKHPLASFFFDYDAYHSEFGSPWGCHCITPEMYAIAYGRRILEDDECAINDSSDSSANLVYMWCEEMTAIVGIPKEVIRENLAYICYENEELTAKVKNLLG